MCQLFKDDSLSIHSLIMRQEVLIAQHVARLLLSLDSIWTIMMRARYGLWPASSEIWASSSSFLLWREICARVSNVILQTRWLLGDVGL